MCAQLHSPSSYVMSSIDRFSNFTPCREWYYETYQGGDI